MLLASPLDSRSRIRMLTQVRTTLVLDDDLVRRAKHRAAELKLTISDVVNHALRVALTEQPLAAAPFRMPTYGAAVAPAHHEPADFSPTADDEAATIGSRR